MRFGHLCRAVVWFCNRAATLGYHFIVFFTMIALIMPYNLSSDTCSLSSRLSYHALSCDDLSRLESLRPIVAPHIERILDDFYAHIASDSKAAMILLDGARRQRAKQAQLRHWLDHVLSGAIDHGYVEAVTRIGQAHVRAGVDLRLFIGGYGFVLRQLQSQPFQFQISHTLTICITVEFIYMLCHFSLFLFIHCNIMKVYFQ